MFIVIEGCEGSGKSSLTELLKNRLITEGKSVIATREPGGSPLGEQVRNWILNPSLPGISPYTELFLFLASRAQHITEKIIPALESGKIVICDRFHDSTIVYQGIAEGLGKEYVTNLCHHVVGEKKFLPDLTCLLDIPVDTGIKRKQQQKSLDKFEDKPLVYHNKIREGFLSLAEANPENYLILDGRQPLEASLNKVMTAYTELALCK
ncbi:thymidylate kinase [Chlamydia felis Fe/C-56]|uniref:Thymidylate kinase n=1 Tax=Chlamydia felis (strain Fe/C-56) TaxID=264202 RepID=KTHY_CHLFF|nr:dTMP kinase [Chlamydia felis]Q254L6.1 RecName: Full=Thymidylate kinase; AltName: Full=dTMP kinase [Chlamydia felis Fe/C-56]BAE81272.1 thymidylate kinase [Chlamydia felis Fe/C-56]